MTLLLSGIEKLFLALIFGRSGDREQICHPGLSRSLAETPLGGRGVQEGWTSFQREILKAQEEQDVP